MFNILLKSSLTVYSRLSAVQLTHRQLAILLSYSNEVNHENLNVVNLTGYLLSYRWYPSYIIMIHELAKNSFLTIVQKYVQYQRPSSTLTGLEHNSQAYLKVWFCLARRKCPCNNIGIWRMAIIHYSLPMPCIRYHTKDYAHSMHKTVCLSLIRGTSECPTHFIRILTKTHTNIHTRSTINRGFPLQLGIWFSI